MSLVRWAELHGAERIATVGSVAVLVYEYTDELQRTLPSSDVGRRARVPVPGLEVVDAETGRLAIHHHRTGLYGFVRLPGGVRRLYIRDPQRRYVERSVEVDVPSTADQQERRRRLEQGVDPGGVGPPTFPEVPLRPSIEYPATAGETIVWGYVRTPQGTPAPYARVQISGLTLPPSSSGGPVREIDSVIHTDAQGMYLAVLHDERIVSTTEDDDSGSVEVTLREFERALSVHAHRRELPQDVESVTSFPSTFDDLDPNDHSAFDPHYVRPATESGSPDPLVVRVGERVRFDVNLVAPP